MKYTVTVVALLSSIIRSFGIVVTVDIPTNTIEVIPPTGIKLSNEEMSNILILAAEGLEYITLDKALKKPPAKEVEDKKTLGHLRLIK